jgi:hypothetical protein
VFERLWLWTDKSPWRLTAVFLVIGAGNAIGFLWHYPWAPVRAAFDAVFAVGFLGAGVWHLLQALRN